MEFSFHYRLIIYQQIILYVKSNVRVNVPFAKQNLKSLKFPFWGRPRPQNLENLKSVTVNLFMIRICNVIVNLKGIDVHCRNQVENVFKFGFWGGHAPKISKILKVLLLIYL